MYPHFWQQIKALQSHLEYVISPGRENEQIQFNPGLSIRCLKKIIINIKQKDTKGRRDYDPPVNYV
jgi:hypothetical protein